MDTDTTTVARPWRRATAAILCVTMAWTPWALVWGDGLHAAAKAGEQEGRTLSAGFAMPQANDGAIRLDGGDSIDLETLFPGMQDGGAGHYTKQYGSDAGARAKGEQAQTDLLTNDTPYGRAYQTLRGSVNRARPPLLHDDALWHQTDEVQGTLDTLKRDFTDCDIDTEFHASTRRVHVADYKTCERFPDYSARCQLVHDYELPDPPEVLAATVPTKSCGRNCIEINSGVFKLDVRRPDLIERVEVDIDFTPGDVLSPQPPGGSIGCRADDKQMWYRVQFPGYLDSNASHGYLTPPKELKENYASKVKNGGLFNIQANQFASTWFESGNDGGTTGFGRCDVVADQPPDGSFLDQNPNRVYIGKPPTITTRVRIYHGDVERPAIDEQWSGSKECIAASKLIGNGFCTGTVSCAGKPALDADGCYTKPGIRICENALRKPPITGQNPFCTRLTVDVDCKDFNRGQMRCWTDTEGVRQCPYNKGNIRNECDKLAKDPQCAYVRSDCVGGAKDADGNCYVFEDTYDCGGFVDIPTVARDTKLDCVGPIDCVGTSCVGGEQEQSDDFAEAAAALQAVQFMLSDSDCASDGFGHPKPETCRVFTGTQEECKRAVGGVVNCCKTPEGVSLSDYMSLVFTMQKLDTAMMGMNEGSVVRGSWELLRDPMVSAWNSVKQAFTSAANNIMGKAAASATDAAAKVGMEGIKQQLMQTAAKWTADVFGPNAANMLFANTAGGPAVTAGGELTGAVQLGGLIGGILIWVMWAYMIYTIVKILIKLIWKCEQSEFELGAKIELRSCHYVGSYCRSDVLGACIERRKSYCCYSTPLARIINEQAYPQLPKRRWGEPENPDCFGLTLAELQTLDWSKVDLDEWLGILMETGNFPTLGDLNIEDLTGTGSRLNTDGRDNVVERTQKRSDEIDGDASAAGAREELWDDTMGTLP